MTGLRHRLATRWRARSRSEDGQLLAMTCVFMTMFLALAGLVADGGHYFDAKQAATSEAEQAARAGASSLDVGQLHAGNLALDPATAVTTAENYMAFAGQPGTAWVVGDTVYAQISYRLPTQLLGIIGVGSFQITVTQSATNVSGTTSEG
ncbi:MAG: pilus assembly protein TadG-related protein [Acidimicrobiales bacterium]